jgi:hypothetical protein
MTRIARATFLVFVLLLATVAAKGKLVRVQERAVTLYACLVLGIAWRIFSSFSSAVARKA